MEIATALSFHCIALPITQYERLDYIIQQNFERFIMLRTDQKRERILGSFASLLSSALTVDGASEPLKDSSGTLTRLMSSSVRSESVCCMIPTLMLKHKDSSRSSHGSIEEYAALNLARPLALTRGELHAAPLTMLGNLIESFMSLVDSRKRSSLAALIRQSQEQKDATLTRVLVGLLACSNDPIAPSTVVTSFRGLQASERSGSDDMVMPLVVETVVDLKIFGTLATISIVAPGTIQASFGPDGMITKAEVVLDTLSFLQSIMKQARYVVRKAIALSSNMARNLLGFSSSSNQKLQQLDEDSSTPSLSRNSSCDDLATPMVKVQSFQNVGSKVDMAASSLMPPPLSRPSKRSIADMSTSCPSKENSMQNATWGEQPLPGLSLLTAAAGMKQSPHDFMQDAVKRLKRSPSSIAPAPRKVTSCPRLETRV